MAVCGHWFIVQCLEDSSHYMMAYVTAQIKTNATSGLQTHAFVATVEAKPFVSALKKNLENKKRLREQILGEYKILHKIEKDMFVFDPTFGTVKFMKNIVLSALYVQQYCDSQTCYSCINVQNNMVVQCHCNPVNVDPGKSVGNKSNQIL